MHRTSSARTAGLQASTASHRQETAFKVLGDTWIEITSAVILETSISYEITDNGPYDSNDVVGVIDDPVTVGVPAPPSAAPTRVPALTFWGLLSLGGLLGLFGLRRLIGQI